MSTAYFQTQLPWTASEGENKRFTRITYTILAITLVLALIVQWVQLPEQTREEKESLPPQLARIIQVPSRKCLDSERVLRYPRLWQF